MLADRVAELDWYHTMDLGGVTTPGREATPRRMARVQMPARLDGRSVLDIGTYDGAYAFEAERRGAGRVLATEVPVSDRRGFDLAHETLNSAVEYIHLNVHDLDPAEIGTFDLVLCLGLLYHLRDPLGGLQHVRSVTKGMAIIETEGDALGIHAPVAAFYEGKELNQDGANWWGFNRRGLLAIVKAAGFSEARVVYCPPRPRRIARAVRDRFAQDEPVGGRSKESVLRACSRGRLVVHACP